MATAAAFVNGRGGGGRRRSSLGARRRRPRGPHASCMDQRDAVGSPRAGGRARGTRNGTRRVGHRTDFVAQLDRRWSVVSPSPPGHLVPLRPVGARARRTDSWPWAALVDEDRGTPRRSAVRHLGAGSTSTAPRSERYQALHPTRTILGPAAHPGHRNAGATRTTAADAPAHRRRRRRLANDADDADDAATQAASRRAWRSTPASRWSSIPVYCNGRDLQPRRVPPVEGSWIASTATRWRA